MLRKGDLVKWAGIAPNNETDLGIVKVDQKAGSNRVFVYWLSERLPIWSDASLTQKVQDK